MAESKFKDRDEQYYVSELERLFKKQLETKIPHMAAGGPKLSPKDPHRSN